MKSSRGMKMVQLVTPEYNKVSPVSDIHQKKPSSAPENCDNGDELGANLEDFQLGSNSDAESELTQEQTQMAAELSDLFGSDLSDDDPTFYPYKTPADSSSSNNSPINEVTSCHEVPQLPADIPYDHNIQSSEEFQIAESIMNEVLLITWKSIRPLKRWRTAHPENWAINIAKRRRMEGMSYKLKNKAMPAKLPKAIECDTCKYKCTTTFSPEDRNKLCRYYWSLDFKCKKNFLLSNVKLEAPKRVLCTRKPNRKPRSYSKSCFFLKGDDLIQVCQNFLCKTLCISPDVIKQAIEARNEFGLYVENDKRGRKDPPNKSKPEMIEYVKSHIESFPSMEAHYVRKDSRRKYLDQQLNIKKMYDLYLESCTREGITERVSEITYRRIFANDYNLSFFVPKKDQCLVCTKYDKASPTIKRELELSYNQHLERKNKCNAEKVKDKEKSNVDKSYMSITFDMQAILQIPSCNVGLLYYTRKLCVYNLTLYEAPLPNAGYCFCWSEVNGRKGSCEVGSVLYYFLKNCISHDVREISLYSDTCGGQNRNQYVAALLLWAVQNIEHIHVIEQKFLESGHSHMEADSMHSSIESAKKNASIYGMPDWLAIFQRARRQKSCTIDNKKVIIEPYKVKEFKFNEFLDLKTLAGNMLINKTKDNNGNKVQWLKMKILRYVKGEPDRIYFNYDMSESFLHIDISTKHKSVKSRSYSTRIQNRSAQSSPALQPQTPGTDTQLKPLYDKPLPISVAKKSDLVKLCKKGVIPEEYHGWFNSLATSSTIVDRLPEPANDESSDEEGF